MSRARELSRLGNPNIISADSSFNVGFGTAEPKEKVNVVGVGSATSFFGDGSGLDGIASAGSNPAFSVAAKTWGLFMACNTVAGLGLPLAIISDCISRIVVTANSCEALTSNISSSV